MTLTHAQALVEAPKPQERTQAEQAKPQTDHAAGSNSVPAAAVESVKEIESAEYTAPCPEGRDNRSSDLCAQWKAADGASNAAWWAEWQTYLSAIGIGGLLYSLYLTRTATMLALDATKDADRALEIAARNADAAIAANEISRDTARRQLRAYVFVERILFTDHGVTGSSDANLKIINTGGTPAYRLRSVVQIAFAQDRRAQFDLPDIDDEQNKAIIMDVGGSGGLRSRLYTRKARDFPDKKAIRATDCYAHIFGRISYIDCFDVERNGRFHFVGRADPLRTGSIEVDYADQGNEYD